MNLDTDVAIAFLDFVAERHRVWAARQLGLTQPWTDDPTVATRKFTNVYRVLDPGSQFVLTDLYEPDISERDVLARLFLYRYTNLPSTWHAMRDALGRYPLAKDMRYNPLTKIIQAIPGKKFSGAYMIIPQPNRPGDKVEQVVDLAHTFVEDEANNFLAATSQPERLNVLKRLYGVGNFLAMQIMTDWGYVCGEDRENEFIVHGPGSWKGARHLDPNADTVEVIRWAHRAIEADGRVVLPLPNGRVRLPSLMDAQNCLCELSKYVRGPVSQPYRPAHPGPQPVPVYPEAW